jgi:hypothetical protein
MMRLSLGFESSGSAIAVIGGNGGKGRIEFERNDYSTQYSFKLGRGEWRRGKSTDHVTHSLFTCCLFFHYY